MGEEAGDDVADSLGGETLRQVDIDDVAVDVDLFDPTVLEQPPGEHVGGILHARCVIRARVVAVSHPGERAIRLEPDHAGAGDGGLFGNTNGLTHE